MKKILRVIGALLPTIMFGGLAVYFGYRFAVSDISEDTGFAVLTIAMMAVLYAVSRPNKPSAE